MKGCGVEIASYPGLFPLLTCKKEPGYKATVEGYVWYEGRDGGRECKRRGEKQWRRVINTPFMRSRIKQSLSVV